MDSFIMSLVLIVTIGTIVWICIQAVVERNERDLTPEDQIHFPLNMTLEEMAAFKELVHERVMQRRKEAENWNWKE